LPKLDLDHFSFNCDFDTQLLHRFTDRSLLRRFTFIHAATGRQNNHAFGGVRSATFPF
jgi:hypothetical protein